MRPKSAFLPKQRPRAQPAPGQRKIISKRSKKQAEVESEQAAALADVEEAESEIEEEELEEELVEEAAVPAEADEVSDDASPFDNDPFATAYDLEKGEPIESERFERSVLPHRSKIRSAREFFSTEILYRHDILLSEDREAMAGTCRVELKGYRGGVWTLTLGDQINIVNRREDADVVLVMQQRDFLNLVNGELNPQLAILAKKVRISGDLKRVLALQSLFAPAAE